MIFITSIYDNGKRVSDYVVNANIVEGYIKSIKDDVREGYKHYCADEISNLFFDLIDIETNAVKHHVDFRDIADFYDEIFGVYNFGGSVFFIAMDRNTWGILDYIDDIEFSGFYEDCNDLVESLGKVIVDKTDTYSITSDNTCIVFYIKDITPFDGNNNVFWHNNRVIENRSYFSIFDIYLDIFKSGIDISPDTDVYIYIKSTTEAYKLDINQKVIRFMTKVAVLRR